MYSKHLDKYKPGDRKSTCFGKMKPIALTFKENNNKYSSQNIGEIMILHICSGCGSISKNRIAGDDNEYSIMTIYEESFNLNKETLNTIADSNIQILTKEDRDIVDLRVYGK